MLNRGLDIIVSLVGLLILLLMLPVIAVLIKLDSAGPIFYAGRRVGKDGKIFRMFKFRTMYSRAPSPAGERFPPGRSPSHPGGPVAEAPQAE